MVSGRSALLYSNLLFFILLFGIYMSKKNMDNIENKIYKRIMLFDVLNILSEILFMFIPNLVNNEFIGEKFGALTSAFSTCWMFFLTFYIIVIANENNEEFKKNLTNEKVNKYIRIIEIYSITLELLLPARYYVDANGVPTGIIGLASYGCYFHMIIAMIYSAYTVIKNRKNIDKKKILPFIVMAASAVMIIILMAFIPNFFTVYFFFNLVTFLMYFTIENPDLKVIAELSLARDQAEKSNRAKSDFLSSMSHEIRTPLNAIVGLSQMISESDNVEDMRSDSKDILVASQNLLEIVNGILDINKIDAGKMELIKTNYNPINEFETVTKMIKIRLGNKPIEFIINYNDLPNTLYGDKEKIKQILTNLLTNAIKYTESGKVYFDATFNKKELILTVQDTGRGIKEEQKDKLFTKFNRLEEDKDSDIEGTGLGLAITKSLVDLMDGSIEVESTYRVGSTFKVIIPQQIVETEELI